MKYQELEVKFYVSSLILLQDRILGIGGTVESDRIAEVNLRFDLPDASLSSDGKALRLRQDSASRLTFKGPSQSEGGARLRQEVEFIVSDFNAAKTFLEALGYEVVLVYEKFRTTYRVQNSQVMFDELPYGDFIEIEGDDPNEIYTIANQLGLNWEARIPESYSFLFDQLKENTGLSFRDLTFNNFSELNIDAKDLSVLYADLPSL